MQHPRSCWAGETTQAGASATLYGGTGGISIVNNETSSDEYDVRRAGAGIFGVVRLRQLGKTQDDSDSGIFFAGGLTAESAWIKQTQCGFLCIGGAVPSRSFHQESEVGVRLGAGYSFSLFEFRVGFVATQPSKGAAFTAPLLLPDVLLRIGSRQSGSFELGLGAYDASTTLRPGLYVGGSLFSPDQVRISGHLGLHLLYGSLESTVEPFGGMADLQLEHAFSETWLGGLGGKVMSGSLFEGNLRLTRLF